MALAICEEFNYSSLQPVLDHPVQYKNYEEVETLV